MQASWGAALVLQPNSPLLTPTSTSSFGFALAILPSMLKSTKRSRNAETQPRTTISLLAGLPYFSPLPSPFTDYSVR